MRRSVRNRRQHYQRHNIAHKLRINVRVNSTHCPRRNGGVGIHFQQPHLRRAGGGRAALEERRGIQQEET